MTTLQKVCGMSPTAPTAGVNTYQNDILQGSILHYIIVNNVNENGLSPTPDYTFNPTEGIITRQNEWQLGDKVVFVYSKCCS